MKLPSAPGDYSSADQSRLRAELTRRDAENLKRGRDIVFQPEQRLIMPDETSGDLYRITIVAGVLTATAL